MLRLLKALFSTKTQIGAPATPTPAKKRQPPPGAIAEAKKPPNKPNGHVYEIEGNYGSRRRPFHPEAIRGAWKIDENGNNRWRLYP